MEGYYSGDYQHPDSTNHYADHRQLYVDLYYSLCEEGDCIAQPPSLIDCMIKDF